MTPPPSREKVADLTVKNAATPLVAEVTPKDRRINIVASVVLVAIIGALWIVFR
jgi:hypothetical protein